MSGQNLLYSIILIIVASLHIATTSIGLQCGNENQEYALKYPNNNGFLLTQLVVGVITVIGALISFYYSVTYKSSPF